MGCSCAESPAGHTLHGRGRSITATFTQAATGTRTTLHELLLYSRDTGNHDRKTECSPVKLSKGMAISMKTLAIIVLLVTLLVLEKRDFTFPLNSSILDFLEPHGEPFLTHTRGKRNVLSDPGTYTATILLNASNVETYEQLLLTLNASSYPLQLDNNTEIQDITVTTVCVSTDNGFQCKCEKQFAWPYSTCITYGACDYMSSGICKCISGIPADGSSCQLISDLPVQTEYEVDLELNLTNTATLDFIRSLLKNVSFFTLNPLVSVTQVDLTTVCSPSNPGYQCRCEDQYRWSCDQCLTYGSCDNITDHTCGCVSAIPADGRYCQSLDQYSPPVIYHYMLYVELNSTDVTAVEELRNISYPISINSNIQISDVNISTVCSPSNRGHQCRCEDQYRWSCDQCLTYGSCDNITDDTCGCISAIPADGQYCQSLDQYNFTACLRTALVPTTSIAQPIIYQYIFSVELNTTDVAAVEALRNFSYPISISHGLQITDVNISTVCSPNNTTYQCRCEDQYGWPCGMCSTFGNCSNNLDNICGCIKALPPDNTYCQPLSGPSFCLFHSPGRGTLGLTVPVRHLRSPTSQPQQIGLLLQLDSVPYCRCPLPGSGIAAATDTTDLTATGSSIDNRCGEHGPLGLYVSIPRNLVKALPEVGVEYIFGRGLCQMFPTDPHYALGPAKSVQLSPLPADATHHQVVISGQLSPSLHPSVQNVRPKIGEAIPPDHASPGVTVVSHVGVEVPQQNNGVPGRALSSTPDRDAKKARYSALPPGLQAETTVRDLSPTQRRRDATLSSTGELGRNKQTHPSPPPLPVGHSRVEESPASLEEMGSRAHAVRRASLSIRGSGRRGLHLRPLPNPLCTGPSRFPLQVVGPLGDSFASLLSGLAWPGPARSNPATRGSLTGPDPRPGSRVGPWLRHTGRRHVPRSCSPHEGVLNRSLSDPSPRACLPCETLPGGI
ncbi:hypothetical protein CRENBAI_001360 [Crenichthys baileyi]|uniref:ADGRF3/5-like N-terminal domain-containing protein n=1 Tax=Crenichthys baileyi TaxID=28760 RepID=A0AAV9QW17_9TELE